MLEASAPKPVGTRVVMRSTAWNLLGRAGPTVIALFATPYLLHQLGDSRWGVFTIGLSLIGIFGVFDFGLERALTRAIAERASAGEMNQAASLVLTGMLALTALGAVVAAGLVHHWVNGGLRIAPELRDECGSCSAPRRRWWSSTRRCGGALPRSRSSGPPTWSIRPSWRSTTLAL